MNHKVLPVVAAGLLSLSMVAVAAPAAMAVPSYCSAVQYGNGTDAYCYTSAAGTQFRAVASCRYYISATGTYAYTTNYGAWQIQGDPSHSYAFCSAGWEWRAPDAQTK